jgi:hypothetical protein
MASAGVGILAWAEIMNWRASRSALGDGVARGGREAVVVLGYRNTGRRANFVNRHRVRMGLRSQNPDVAESVLVLCGGAVADEVSEAELMARYARERGYAGEIRIDAASTTTTENIRNAIPLIADADTIKIVSHSPHAAIGREYLRMVRPDLAARLVRGDDYRFGEAPVLKVAAAIIAAGYRSASAR